MEFPCAFHRFRARANRLGTVFRDEGKEHRIRWRTPVHYGPSIRTPDEVRWLVPANESQTGL